CENAWKKTDLGAFHTCSREELISLERRRKGSTPHPLLDESELSAKRRHGARKIWRAGMELGFATGVVAGYETKRVGIADVPTRRGRCGQALSEFNAGANAPVEGDSGLFPLSLDGALRETLQGADLGEGEAAKELQVDDLGQVRLRLGEVVQRSADQRQLSIVDLIVGRLGGEGGDLELTAPLLGEPATDMVDDQAPH